MKLNSIILSLVAALLASLAASCHSTDDWDNDPYGNFDALWSLVDRHYCYFEEKGVDWDAIGREYRARITPDMNKEELFDLMAAMLNNLRDGHTNLSSAFNVSYYRQWWSDYPQNYDDRLVKQYYLNFDWNQAAGLSYAILPDSIGYIRYPSFASGIGDANINYALYYMRDCPALIIDIRNNGGGDLTNAERLASHFVKERQLGGYIYHKSGPGHNDFSQPYPYYIETVPRGSVIWLRPVVVLTNRSTFSAANNFTAMMKSLPMVWIAGATTGGGSAMPLTQDLPNGWRLRMSASPILTAQGETTEHGIPPSEGCAVDLDPELALQGIDTMIDFAVDFLISKVDSILNSKRPDSPPKEQAAAGALTILTLR